MTMENIPSKNINRNWGYLKEIRSDQSSSEEFIKAKKENRVWTVFQNNFTNSVYLVSGFFLSNNNCGYVISERPIPRGEWHQLDWF